MLKNFQNYKPKRPMLMRASMPLNLNPIKGKIINNQSLDISFENKGNMF